MLYVHCFLLLLCYFGLGHFVNTQQVGDSCELPDGTFGQCANIEDCKTAKQDIAKGQRPQHCGFDGLKPIVCCSIFPGAKTKYFCSVYHQATTPHYIVGGEFVQPKDYQHMVALGYGDETDIQWLCGGSLISNDFVLTAAHCLNAPEYGPVRWAKIGELNISSTTWNTTTELDTDFEIIRTFRHPDYKPPSKYNDIALLQLHKQVLFSIDRKPACINTDYNITSEFTPTATGWGLTSYVGTKSERLLVVDLNLVSHERCKANYKNESKKRLANGIDDKTQLCAGGDHKKSKDTCQGDSGGPLQIKHPKYPYNFYLLIGVTSFGKGCGIANISAVYTRISHYVPWIESIVWKNYTIHLGDFTV